MMGWDWMGWNMYGSNSVLAMELKAIGINIMAHLHVGE